MIKKARQERTRFMRGSGNVFADIGLPDPEEALAKARLAEAIAEAIKRRNLTQSETATILGVDQPKISLIVNGRLDGFTQDRLIRYLTALGNDVEIVVRRRHHDNHEEHGHLSVIVEALGRPTAARGASARAVRQKAVPPAARRRHR